LNKTEINLRKLELALGKRIQKDMERLKVIQAELLRLYNERQVATCYEKLKGERA
jgi:hypothetical protein